MSLLLATCALLTLIFTCLFYLFVTCVCAQSCGNTTHTTSLMLQRCVVRYCSQLAVWQSLCISGRPAKRQMCVSAGGMDKETGGTTAKCSVALTAAAIERRPCDRVDLQLAPEFDWRVIAL